MNGGQSEEPVYGKTFAEDSAARTAMNPLLSVGANNGSAGGMAQPGALNLWNPIPEPEESALTRFRQSEIAAMNLDAKVQHAIATTRTTSNDFVGSNMGSASYAGMQMASAQGGSERVHGVYYRGVDDAQLMPVVDWRGVGSSVISLAGNGAGVVTGGILMGGGVGLMVAPEPAISKATGAWAIGIGAANVASSSVGFVNSARNLWNAWNDKPATLPDSGTKVLAEAMFPGSQTAQDLATAADLSLALVSGRVPVGTTTINFGSALAQRVPVGINGLLDAKAVAVLSAMSGILLPSAGSAKSFGSWALDSTQVLQLGSFAYDRVSPPNNPQTSSVVVKSPLYQNKPK